MDLNSGSLNTSAPEHSQVLINNSDHPDNIPQKPGKIKKVAKSLLHIGTLLIVSIIIFYFIYLFLVIPTQINGNPLKPFSKGQYVLAEKVSYLIGSPVVGDRVVFTPPERGSIYVGIITEKTDDNNPSYTIRSSGAGLPWKVTKQNINMKIYYPFMSNQEVLQIAISQLPTPTPSPTPTNSFANWQTYASETLGFTIQYPPDWNTTEYNKNFVITPQKNISKLSQNPTGEEVYKQILIPFQITKINDATVKDLEQQRQALAAQSGISVTQKNTTISGNPATEYNVRYNITVGSIQSGDTYTTFIIKHKPDNNYMIGIFGPEQQTLNNILSTLKFTE